MRAMLCNSPRVWNLNEEMRLLFDMETQPSHLAYLSSRISPASELGIHALLFEPAGEDVGRCFGTPTPVLGDLPSPNALGRDIDKEMFHASPFQDTSYDVGRCFGTGTCPSFPNAHTECSPTSLLRPTLFDAVCTPTSVLGGLVGPDARRRNVDLETRAFLPGPLHRWGDAYWVQSPYKTSTKRTISQPRDPEDLCQAEDGWLPPPIPAAGFKKVAIRPNFETIHDTLESALSNVMDSREYEMYFTGPRRGYMHGLEDEYIIRPR